MKKKAIVMLIALSLTYFIQPKAEADSCWVCFSDWSNHCPPEWGSCCYGSGGSCYVNECFPCEEK